MSGHRPPRPNPNPNPNLNPDPSPTPNPNPEQVPEVFWAATTPRVLTMEFVPSFKLTDIARVEAEGLDRNLLAKRTADAFLAQILRSSYFHCDPHPGAPATPCYPPLLPWAFSRAGPILNLHLHLHPHPHLSPPRPPYLTPPGNLCVNKEGQLVYYDCGMMNELTPDIAAGFKEARRTRPSHTLTHTLTPPCTPTSPLTPPSPPSLRRASPSSEVAPTSVRSSSQHRASASSTPSS